MLEGILGHLKNHKKSYNGKFHYLFFFFFKPSISYQLCLVVCTMGTVITQTTTATTTTVDLQHHVVTTPPVLPPACGHPVPVSLLNTGVVMNMIPGLLVLTSTLDQDIEQQIIKYLIVKYVCFCFS